MDPSANYEGKAVNPRYGYLTPKLAADFTGISLQELERLRREGGGPPFCRVSSRLVRYKVADVCDCFETGFNLGGLQRHHAAERDVVVTHLL